MTKAAREKIERVSRDKVLDLPDETIDAILAALKDELVPEGCVAVCSKCRLEHWGSLIGCGLDNCPPSRREAMTQQNDFAARIAEIKKRVSDFVECCSPAWIEQHPQETYLQWIKDGTELLAIVEQMQAACAFKDNTARGLQRLLEGEYHLKELLKPFAKAFEEGRIVEVPVEHFRNAYKAIKPQPQESAE